MRAEDVKRSFERSMRTLTREMPAAYAAIEGSAAFVDGDSDEVPGLLVRAEFDLEIRLSEPLAIYPAFMTDIYTGIGRALPQESGRVVGTGPFSMKERSESRVVLERNTQYWRSATSLVDTVEFRTSTGASSIAEQFRAGQLDLARDLLPKDLDEILRDSRFRRGLVEVPLKNTYFILFNCRSGPVAEDIGVRLALSRVIGTHDLVWRTLGRFAQPATSLIPPGILGHDPGRRRKALSVEEARELLEERGSLKLKASVHPLLQDRYSSLLDALFGLWSELGVVVSIETRDMPSFLESWQSNEGLDLQITRWNAEFDDPDNVTHGLFHSGAGVLHAWYCSDEADRILQDARTEGRAATRQSLYRKFENHLLEAGVLLPLFHDIYYRIANSKVPGLRLRSSPPYVNYAQLGKVEQEAASSPTREAGGGVIHVPASGVVNSLEPSQVYSDDQVEVIPNIYDTLTRRVEGAKIVPALAKDVRVEEGGKIYRFRLREDVRFHDGRKLSARDVRYSFERLLQRGEYRGLLSPIKGADAFMNGESADLEGIEILSAGEFVIELEKPVSFFPVLVSHPASGIVPEGSEGRGTNWRDGCVGTGPFRVVRFEPGQSLELERNPNYWRSGYPRSEGIAFNFRVSPNDILAGFKAGRFSVCSDLFPDDVEALRRESEFASGFRETPHLSSYWVAFNTHSGPLEERAARQSLVRAVEVATLIRQTLGRLAIPATGLIPPGLLGHDPAQPTGAARIDGERPLEGQELRVAVHPMFVGKYASLFREVSKAFKATGVSIRRVNETMEDFLEAADQAECDLVVGRWVGDYPDSDTFVHGVLHSREGFMGRLCGSPVVDRLIERGRAEADPMNRHTLYRQIEETISTEALLLPLFHEQVYRFAQPQVEGLSVSSLPPVVPYEQLRIRS
jgi:peptide/nickel transport system substrate-binding protein/oligopeptide transport system substrate-binding protein